MKGTKKKTQKNLVGGLFIVGKQGSIIDVYGTKFDKCCFWGINVFNEILNGRDMTFKNKVRCVLDLIKYLF